MTVMTIDPVPPHVLLTYDIRAALTLLDMYPIKTYALNRYQAENNINPDHAIIYKLQSATDQKLRAIEAQVVDDLIITMLNSFEHTWIQRDLRHVTDRELTFFNEMAAFRHELFMSVRIPTEYAGMFAHYQRIGESIFLAVPKY